MSFLQCIRRELHWWWTHPSLWWSMPVLLIFVTVLPHMVWFATGIKVLEVEGLWRLGVLAWKMGGRETLASNPMVPVNLLPMLDELMVLQVEDIWKMAVIPSLQVYAMTAMALVVTPVSVVNLRRDIDLGAIRAAKLSGLPVWSFLSAKLLIQGLVFALGQIICMFLALYLYQQGSERPDYFMYSDVGWWMAFMVLGLGLGLLSVMASWVLCLFFRNTATEVYTSSIFASIAVTLASILAQRMGWNGATMASLGAVAWGSIPLGIFLVASVLREKALYRR